MIISVVRWDINTVVLLREMLRDMASFSRRAQFRLWFLFAAPPNRALGGCAVGGIA
ncbi:MAG: hypothetical protein GTO63_06700 [Anaerolineae bacterium]|nr:hypothetical protein [Anaerolineae bacterium]NIN93557.1 hypothetical protein [Anaerolineae bacterium]NIQ76640.1 hypothetical protein [Anaerolineae bacterium]